MVFPDRPDGPGKADLRVSYFLPLAFGALACRKVFPEESRLAV